MKLLRPLFCLELGSLPERGRALSDVADAGLEMSVELERGEQMKVYSKDAIE